MSFGSEEISPVPCSEFTMRIALNLDAGVLQRIMASKTLALEMEKKDDGKLSAAVRECLNEIDRALKRMESDQAEIDRIKAETKAILKKLKAA